ncbi:MAG: site-2 protease family protein [Cyclobacteriaceae bacterium]|nr:site-2 protease family protein [Cyclobacteriaceae bacterium]
MNSEKKRIVLQVFLFVATFVTTTFAGSEWSYGRSVLYTPDYGWSDFISGMQFSVPLLLFLTVHEFGHYFTALYHKVKTSLPYYIPVPPIPFLPFSIGTMGAVIRLRSRPVSNVQHFDIGMSGPLAGFVVAVAIIFYGFITLPPPDYVFQFHPEYQQYGADYASVVYEPEYYQAHESVVDITIGTNLVFLFFEKFIADPTRVPNPHELMHYPVLLAGFIALFVTCLNLLPIGQLDGGHVVYGMFGYKRHRVVATIFFVALLFYSGLGNPYTNPLLPTNELLINILLYIVFLYFAFTGLKLSKRDTAMYAVLMFAVQFFLMYFFPTVEGYTGWLLFAFIVGRFLGIQHPASPIEVPLDSRRIIVGWITLIVFLLCFSPAPIALEIHMAPAP